MRWEQLVLFDVVAWTQFLIHIWRLLGFSYVRFGIKLLMVITFMSKVIQVHMIFNKLGDAFRVGPLSSSGHHFSLWLLMCWKHSFPFSRRFSTWKNEWSENDEKSMPENDDRKVHFSKKNMRSFLIMSKKQMSIMCEKVYLKCMKIIGPVIHDSNSAWHEFLDNFSFISMHALFRVIKLLKICQLKNIKWVSGWKGN